MYRTLLIIVLFFSSFVFAQQEAAPVYDPDFEAELNLFNRFFTSGDAQGAYVHAQKMLDIATHKNLPPRELGAAESTVGEALRKMERYSEAEPHLRRSLALRESVLPRTHYRVLQSLDALGNVLYLENKYDEAARLTERSLAIYATMPDRDGPDECAYGMALQRLGSIEATKKNLDKAEGLLIRATKSFATVGEGCGQLHGVYFSLAGVYWLENRKDKVEEVYRAAVKAFAPEAGEDPDYHYGYYLSCLAGVYTAQKRYDEADALYKQAIQAATHVAGSEGPSASAELMATVTRDYKSMLEASGRKGELAAVEQQRRAAASVAAGNPARPETQLQTLQEEAQQAEQEKRFDDAEKDLRQELEVARSLGSQDPRGILAEVDLGLFLEGRNKPNEALRVTEQALAEARQAAIDDPDILGRVYSALVVLYSNRHNDAAVEPVLKQSVDLWAKNQASLHYPSALGALGQFYVSRRQFNRAEPLYLQALQVVERTQGPDSFQVISSVERLGYLYAQMGDWAKAEPYYRRVLALHEKQFGTNSPMLNGTLYQLAEVMRNLGRPNEANEFLARRERLNNSAPITQK